MKSEGAKGGLCLLWNDQKSVTINSFSQNHIESTIEWCGKTWQFTGIYGYLETNKKELTWKLIKSLKRSPKMPWLLGGDINEVLNNKEKIGGPLRQRKFLDEFRSTLHDCELKDLKPKGDFFTWYGTRGGTQIWERLDRFVYNSEFELLYSRVEVINLHWMTSNHRPIELQLESIKARRNSRENKVLKI